MSEEETKSAPANEEVFVFCIIPEDRDESSIIWLAGSDMDKVLKDGYKELKKVRSGHAFLVINGERYPISNPEPAYAVKLPGDRKVILVGEKTEDFVWSDDAGHFSQPNFED